MQKLTFFAVTIKCTDPKQSISIRFVLAIKTRIFGNILAQKKLILYCSWNIRNFNAQYEVFFYTGTVIHYINHADFIFRDARKYWNVSSLKATNYSKIQQIFRRVCGEDIRPVCSNHACKRVSGVHTRSVSPCWLWNFVPCLILKRSASKIVFIFEHGYIGQKNICNSSVMVFTRE